MAKVVMKTMACTQSGDVFVLVHGPVDPAPEEWARIIELGRASRLPKHLVVAGEVQLSPRQRSQVAETLREFPCKAAVMLSSPVTRGMVTAIGWLTGKHRAFGMGDLEGALSYLGVPLADHGRVKDAVATLKRELGGAI
jgi:hypothetical protein